MCSKRLRASGMADCMQLLHFHLGSQITNIRQVKGAVSEAIRVYVELKKAGAGLQFMDVGGGLGIDYDGSQTDFESSVNYTLQEYANDVVYHIQNVCDEAEVPHPTIITESGRAVAAYHSVLVFNVLGVSEFGEPNMPQELPEDAEQPLIDLQETYQVAQLQESARKLPRCAAGARFGVESVQPGLSAAAAAEPGRELLLGDLPAHSAHGRRTRLLPRGVGRAGKPALRHVLLQFLVVPEHAGQLGGEAVFPDHADPPAWSEPPTRHAVLGDISCDSDGKVDQFIDRRDVKKTLRLHALNGKPYYLGAFLVGAYQEILGDLHNLFGDTNAVHVNLGENGEVMLDAVIRGDTVREVLDYVQFNSQMLLEQYRKDVEAALLEGRIGYEESGRLLRFYEQGLNGYTYLEDAAEH